MKHTLMLSGDEYIITAFAKHCSGPGWANSPIVVVIGEHGKPKREHYIQPDEQTAQMRALFAVCAAANAELTGWVASVSARNKNTNQKTAK